MNASQHEKNYFLQVMELCIPHSVVKVKRDLLWINKEIIGEIKGRDALFCIAKAHGQFK